MAAKTIPLSELKQLLKSGHPLSILDVRTPAEFSRVHAAGAKLLPFDELNADEIATARQGNADPLYVICHSGARSAKACERLQEAGLVISSVSAEEGLVEIIELPDHPFYIGAQFHPEFQSKPNHPHPLFAGFVAAALERSQL